MQYAIDKLLEDREKRIENLKLGKTEELELLKDLDEAIAWLKLISNENLDSANKYSIQTLHTTSGYGYSYYHLMIDMETNDVTRWIEYKPNGEALELCGGDIIFIRK